MVLVAVGVVCLMAVFYSAYHSSWTGRRQLASWTDAVVYFVLPAFLSLVSFLSLRCKRQYQIVLSIFWVFLVMSTYTSELYLSRSKPDLLRPTQPIMSFSKNERVRMAARLQKEFGVVVDTRDRKEVVAEHRKAGTEAVPQIILPPVQGERADTESRVTPLSGVANTMTVVCNQNGEYLTYRTDLRGFHNESDIWAGPVEIAAIGNSWTLGYCVPSDRNFVALIRKRYTATLNLGMPNEGPLHALAVLQEYATVLKPKTVLWFYAEGSSLSELATEKDSRLLLDYLAGDFSQRLFDRQSEVDEAVRFHVERQSVQDEETARAADRGSSILDNSREFIKLTTLRQTLGLVEATRTPAWSPVETETLEPEPDTALLRDSFRAAKTRISDWGGTLYVVYLPSPGRYFAKLPVMDRTRREILELLRLLDIPFLDVTPAFDAHQDPVSLFPFRRPGHPNEQGHRLIAETVLSWLLNVLPNENSKARS